MLVEPKDIVRSLEGKGGEGFEAFLHDLLTLEARSAGLSATAVDWDHRINVPDGGKDICVSEGTNTTSSLIPQSPSIWSAKAGVDGISPAKLGKEVKTHEAIEKHLAQGNAFRYVILKDCSTSQRTALRAKADELCVERSIANNSIQVVFNDRLAEFASRCPSLIPQHLPDLQQRLGTGATTVDTWVSDLRHNGTTYKEINSRIDVVDQLLRLLGGDPDIRYIHIAGWSGIGKSRLVSETVSGDEASTLAIVYQTWSDFETGLLPALRSGQVKSALVIVDDVDVSKVNELRNLCESRPALQLISVGASETQSRLPKQCLFLERPSTDDLSSIIRARTNSSIEDSVVDRIANLAQGDVRFAQLLADAALDIEATDESPGSLIEALGDLAAVVTHYFKQHQDSIGDPIEYRRMLAVITLLAEVGGRGSREDELVALADFCGKEISSLRTAISEGEKIGVCQWAGDLVECIPRPLATHLFERDAWAHISSNLLDFYNSLPNERSRRAFFRRVAYCPSLQREEVERSLGDMFRVRFANSNLTTLTDGDLAHTLRTLIEVIPQDGLAWLRRLIETATVEELLEFPGSTAVYGPTYGRREIVWLCEHLRCFDDCFESAEAILFRLALAETEQLGNNATAEWLQCFWWRLSGTEVSFEGRVGILIDRLKSADPAMVDLLLKGAFSALHDPMSATTPPEFVGGRATPSEWKPKIWGDIYDQWDKVIAELIELSKQEALRKSVVMAIIGDLELIVRRGLPEGIREITLDLEKLEDQQIRLLREALDRLVGPYSHLDEDVKSDILAWRNTLSPRSLAEQIREVVGRDVWSHERADENADSWRLPYEGLVNLIAEEPEVLMEVEDWMSSGEAKSPRALASMLGKESPSQEAVKDIVVGWLNAGKCMDFVVGYFIGVAGDDRVLPDWAIEILSSISNNQPDAVVQITVEADVTERGVDRVISLLTACNASPSLLLNRLFGLQWEAVLTPGYKILILNSLLATTEDEYAVTCGLHLLTMWYNSRKGSIEDELDDTVGQLVQAVLDGHQINRTYEWEGAMRWWSHRHPDEASNLLVQTMTTIGTNRFSLTREAEKILISIAAKFPDAVSAALEHAMSNEKTRISFHISVYRGLFEHLGVERIAAMIERLGEDGASAIARHLPDPGADSAGNIADWFLRKYANNDRVFSSYLCGRHSGVVVSGYAYQRRDEVYQRTASHMKSENPGIRKWAEWERAEIDIDAERDRKMVDEMGRE